jgi:hypothetical protein
MKRLTLVLLAVLLSCTLATAQVPSAFQPGMAQLSCSAKSRAVLAPIMQISEDQGGKATADSLDGYSEEQLYAVVDAAIDCIHIDITNLSRDALQTLAAVQITGEAATMHLLLRVQSERDGLQAQCPSQPKATDEPAASPATVHNSAALTAHCQAWARLPSETWPTECSGILAAATRAPQPSLNPFPKVEPQRAAVINQLPPGGRPQLQLRPPHPRMDCPAETQKTVEYFADMPDAQARDRALRRLDTLSVHRLADDARICSIPLPACVQCPQDEAVAAQIASFNALEDAASRELQRRQR